MNQVSIFLPSLSKQVTLLEVNDKLYINDINIDFLSYDFFKGISDDDNLLVWNTFKIDLLNDGE